MYVCISFSNLFTAELILGVVNSGKDGKGESIGARLQRRLPLRFRHTSPAIVDN